MRNLSNLNVCFLAGTLAQGGAERQLFYILQALCRAGGTPRLLSLSRGEFWEESIKGLGVSITCVGDQGARLKRLVRIVKELWRDPPDVLQSQHFYTNAYVSVAARLLRSRGIGALRSNGEYDVSDSGRLGGWLNLHLPRTIAVNSQNAIRYAMARGVAASRLFFLPNVVDTEWFQPANSVQEESVTLVAVGRLVREKRLDRFVSALGRLRNDFHLNVRGLIVGPGSPAHDLRPELENQARNLRLLPNSLQFLGGISDVRSIYAQAAICVLTSEWEGTPNVLLEAMACGLPVVATKVGGVSEIVEHQRTGLLVDPDNLDGLATALAELVRNRELRIEMGRRARTFVEERHSVQRLPTYLDRLYNVDASATRQAPAPVPQGSLI